MPSTPTPLHHLLYLCQQGSGLLSDTERKVITMKKLTALLISSFLLVPTAFATQVDQVAPAHGEFESRQPTYFEDEMRTGERFAYFEDEMRTGERFTYFEDEMRTSERYS